MLSHLHSSIKTGKMKIRFCLDQKVEASVKQLRLHTAELDRLDNGPQELRILLIDIQRQLSGTIRLPQAEVIPNVRNNTTSTAAKRTAISNEQHLNTKKALNELFHDLRRRFVTPRMRVSAGMDLVHWLSDLHDKAHSNEVHRKKCARAAKVAAALKDTLAEQLKVEVEAELRPRLRAELEDELRETLRKELLGAVDTK
jgi:hypothetical protein